MDSKKQIEDIVQEVTSDGLFDVVQLTYDEARFGNVLVVLRSSGNTVIRCIRDRGDGWCDIGSSKHPDDWFHAEDMLTTIGIPVEDWRGDIVGAIALTLVVVKRNLARIEGALDEKGYGETRDRVERLQKERAARRFGLAFGGSE